MRGSTVINWKIKETIGVSIYNPAAIKAVKPNVNYYGTGRSNYFVVKDDKAFESFLLEFDSRITFSRGDKVKPKYAREDKEPYVLFSNEDDGGIPWMRTERHIRSRPRTIIANEDPREETHQVEEQVEFDFLEELSAHLHESSVMIWTETGSEGHRYVHGHACAVNCKNERETVNLSDIMGIVKKRWGIEASDPSY